jgi:hypothetical protein
MPRPSLEARLLRLFPRPGGARRCLTALSTLKELPAAASPVTGSELCAAVILAIVIVGMITRPLFPRLPVWSVMSLAAFVAVVPGPVSVDQIPSIVNFEVLLFLVGMFSIVALAESSGLLDAVATGSSGSSGRDIRQPSGRPLSSAFSRPLPLTTRSR